MNPKRRRIHWPLCLSIKPAVTDRDEQVDCLMVLALRDFQTMGLVECEEVHLEQELREEALRIKSQCPPPTIREIAARIRGTLDLPKKDRKDLVTLFHRYFTSDKFFRAIEASQRRRELQRPDHQP